MKERIIEIIHKYHADKTRLMDIMLDIQDECQYIPEECLDILSKELVLSIADIEQTISFYHFFSQKPRGKYQVYINQSAVAYMMGQSDIIEAFEDELGITLGSVTEDGAIGIFGTADIGMNDQEPAILINKRVFTQMTPYRVRQLIDDMKAGKDVKDMAVKAPGSGKNSDPLIDAMVHSNIFRIGPLLANDYKPFDYLKDNLSKIKAESIVEELKKSNLRGRGGAGFPTGLKWDFCRKSSGHDKYVICNADEGEPGTFKDRVILTEMPELVFEGMAIAGYTIDAHYGILYLRYEYKYLETYLNDLLNRMREEHLLGENIAGISGFNFDIRIQFGAGAYVCGEESALIESMLGKRGEPRDKPPFPVEQGYLDQPTAVNNVETFAAVVKILTKGADWFKKLGTADSAGTKVLSISGDCQFPGIYEVEWGITIQDMLDMVGAKKTQAVQVGGPSGTLIGPEDFQRSICYTDLSTGGSMIIFNRDRNLLKDVVRNFMEFFIDESCGSCSTCRIMPAVMLDKLDKILHGKGVKQDIRDLEEWGTVLKASRCGLGQTAGNPIVMSIKNFRHLYNQLLNRDELKYNGFNLEEAIQESCQVVGREPVIDHGHLKNGRERPECKANGTHKPECPDLSGHKDFEHRATNL